MTPARKPPHNEEKLKTQYNVYIYRRPGEFEGEEQNWELKTITSDKRRAFIAARALNRNKLYEKIEVQKHIFDPANQCEKAVKLKTFGKKKRRRLPAYILAAFLIVTGMLVISVVAALLNGI